MRPSESYLEQHSAPLLEFAKHMDAAVETSPDRSCVVQEAGHTPHVVEFKGTAFFEPSQEPTTEADAEERAAMSTIRRVAERALISQSEIHAAALLGKIGLLYNEDANTLPPYSATYTKGEGRYKEHGIANMVITHLMEGDTIEAPRFASKYDLTIVGKDEMTETLSLHVYKGAVADVDFEVVAPDASTQLKHICDRVFGDEQQRTVRDIIRGGCDATTLDGYIRELNRSYARLPGYGKYVPDILKFLRRHVAVMEEDKRNAADMRDVVGPSFYWPTTSQISGMRTALGHT